jgi:hypothetical protein
MTGLCFAAALVFTATASTDSVATPIKFARGKSSKTIEGAGVRGDRDLYTFEAKAKQTLSIKITSLENNAVLSMPGSKDQEG